MNDDSFNNYEQQAISPLLSLVDKIEESMDNDWPNNEQQTVPTQYVKNYLLIY